MAGLKSPLTPEGVYRREFEWLDQDWQTSELPERDHYTAIVGKDGKEERQENWLTPLDALDVLGSDILGVYWYEFMPHGGGHRRCAGLLYSAPKPDAEPKKSKKKKDEDDGGGAAVAPI